MKRIRFTYYTFGWAFLFAFAQDGSCQLSKKEKLDSLRTKLSVDSAHIYRFKKVKFLLAIDTRNSFIHTNTKASVNFNGFQLGVVLNEKHNVGFGFYSMSHVQKTHPIIDQQKTININLNMGYATIFYEYQFINTKRWEIGVPLEIGSGSYQITATD